MPYRLLADIVLVVHTAIVLFVVLGLVLIVVGGVRGWSWTRRPWFRVLHLAAIAIVVAESWLGITCPLTTWESALRARAGDTQYAAGFVEYWLQRVLFYDLPPWVFTLAYSAFAALVVAAWWRWPPRRARQGT
jgi:hypothetical protein